MIDQEVFAESGLRVVFDAAPVSLWIEDFSDVKVLLDRLRAEGVEDFRAYAAAHPEVVDEAIAAIRVVDVNAHTLHMFRAGSTEELVRRSGEVLRSDMRASFVHELEALWDGELATETEGVNYALDGTPIDVLVRRSGMPGHDHDWARVLVSIVDITQRKQTERQLAQSEARAVAIFEHSPVSLWIEDFSAVKARLDDLRASGVTDLEAHLATHPCFVHECLGLIKVVDVNQRTLELYGATSKQQLIERLDEVLRDGMAQHFARDLLLMWAGTPGQETDGVNYTLGGQPIDIHLEWTVLPGHEEHWDRALVSITDITARKRADEYMRYLGTHDALTGLFNRSYFDEQVRLLTAAPAAGTTGGAPVASLIIADLNGLKQVNDQFGHSAGDLLIRRAGQVLIEATDDGEVAARIGGDEFAVLLPGHDEEAAMAMVRRIEALVARNNERNDHGHHTWELQVAIGCATMWPGTTFGDAFKLADRRMYEHKAGFARS